jgi:hypothetical protein
LKAIQPDSGEDLTIEAGVSRTQVWQRADLTAAESDWLADEVPVALVYNGISHVVMMTTPKDLEAFALGFSLSEGIIDAPGDIFGMDIVPGCHGIEVQIELSSRRFMALKEQRRALAGRTGCGVCGVEQLDQIGKPLSPLPFTQTFALDQLDRALGQLKAYQPVRKPAAPMLPRGSSLMVSWPVAVKMWVAMWHWISCWAIAARLSGGQARCWSPAAPAMKWCRSPPCVGLRSCSQSRQRPAWRLRWLSAAI